MQSSALNSTENAQYTQLTILGFACYAFVYFVTAFSQGKIRGKVFNAEFMK